MQCTTYVPVYYHAKDLNVCENEFSWHLLNGDNNYLEGRGTNVSVSSCTVEQYLGYDKDVWRQIIQNHDATFRFQVGELHRLYRKQWELMDEIKGRGISTHLPFQKLESNHTSSQSLSSCRRTLLPHATGCLIKDFPDGKMPMLSAEDVRKRPFFVAGIFQDPTTVNSSPSLTKTSFNGIEAPPFRSKSHNVKILDLEVPAYLCHDIGKEQFEEASCSACPVILDTHHPNKTRYLIDLNEPASFGLMTSSSSAPFEACSDEIVNGNSCFSEEEAKPEPVLYKHCRLVNCEGSTAEKTSSLDIDLNFTTPLGCILETAITFESTEDMNEEIKVGGSDNAGIISVEEMNLKDRASTENEVSSPIGNSKNIQIETPLFSRQVDGESAMELNKIGAETLIMISTSRIGQDWQHSIPEPVGNSKKTLYWFANIVASADQEIEVITTKQSLQHAGHDFNVKKEKETGKIVGLFKRDSINRTRQHKNCRKTGLLRRNAGKNACATPGKCYKLQHLDIIQRSLDSKVSTCDKGGLLQKCLHGWGKIRKRQEGHRRQASKFSLLAKLS